jgi:putative addiction module CopG family antidote
MREKAVVIVNHRFRDNLTVKLERRNMFTINNLGSGIDAWVREQVSSGRFESEDEVFFEAMRLFRETMENPAVGRAVLQAQLEAGMKGPFRLADKVFAELEAELLKTKTSERAA